MYYIYLNFNLYIIIIYYYLNLINKKYINITLTFNIYISNNNIIIYIHYI